MSNQTPAGWAKRSPVYDDRLPHQIRIVLIRQTRLAVSCTCRQSYSGHFEPLAEVIDVDEAKRLWHEHMESRRP